MNGRDERGRFGVLYVVGMPLGNPGDITARALEVMRAASLIACEDTRRTGRILAEHLIGTPTLSYFEHNEERRTPEIIGRLRAGATIALVTDAGTPAISDPGYRLVRAAHEAGIAVRAVPGPSAPIAALSIAGLPTDRFVFEGFLPPRDAARHNALEALAEEPRTMVFFEAARRLRETLAQMAIAFGGGRMAAVVREISKTHEETVRGTLDQLTGIFAARDALGEITLVVEGAAASRDSVREGLHSVDEMAAVEAMCEMGLSLKQASAVLAKLTGASRRDIYQRALKARASGG